MCYPSSKETPPKTRDSRPLLLGHRGARCSAPENTLAAFELALAHGCDGFEFDVRRTADGIAVICHDPQIAGLEIARKRCSTLQEAAPSLPTLEDVLARFASRAYLYVELKVGGLEDELLRVLQAHPPERGFVAASFRPEILLSVSARSGVVPLGFICDKRCELPRCRVLPVSAVMLNRCLAQAPVIDELHAAGKQVFVWTINRASEMTASAALAVDAILSDDTEWLVRTLGQHE